MTITRGLGAAWAPAAVEAAGPVAAAPAVDMSLKGGLKLSFGDKASPSASPPRRETGASVPKLAPPPVPKLAPPPPVLEEDEFTAFSSAPAAPLEEGWADFADAFPEAS